MVSSDLLGLEDGWCRCWAPEIPLDTVADGRRVLVVEEDRQVKGARSGDKRDILIRSACLYTSAAPPYNVVSLSVGCCSIVVVYVRSRRQNG